MRRIRLSTNTQDNEERRCDRRNETMNKFFKTTDRRVRTPRDPALNPKAKIIGRPFDAIAYAAALEVLG